MKSVFYNTDVLDAEKKLMEKFKIPSVLLMENAGANSAKIIWDFFISEKCSRIVILAGKGNNAGDGFVAARCLLNYSLNQDDFAPICLFMCYPTDTLKGDALTNYNIAKELFKSDYYEITSDSERLNNILDSENEKILFVDAVFGIGFSGELDNYIKNIFADITQYSNKKFVIALDTPSGLNSWSSSEGCLKADVTISMGVWKLNTMFYEGRNVSGEIKLVDIGLPCEKFDEFNLKSIYQFEQEDTCFEEAVRDKNSHKYNNGKLFILAGSEGFSGAAYLSAQSALRTGSGAVILGIPESLNPSMEAKTTEVITLPLKSEKYLTNDSFDIVTKKIEWCDAVLLGPGIGRESVTMSFIRSVIKKFNNNFVIDADGIFAFKDNLDLLKKEKCSIILTPHTGEFANLLGITTDELKQDFINIAKKFASDYNVVLVLKNSPTIITDGNIVFINSTGRENLATIGSGDVLSGIISSLVSQMNDVPLINIASSGVFLHGYCGDKLYAMNGCSGTIAGDLIQLIPSSKNEILKSYNI
ncbi:MAG: NAD(P)H-hydrate dehydratase [Candidatus Kapaibacterium sp.]